MPTELTRPKKALTELTVALRDVHRALLKVEQARYEREWGPVGDPGQLLQLLTKHPQFDWLHQLSEFMAGIDALLDEDEEAVSEAAMQSIFVQAKSMLAQSSAEPSEFSMRYFEAMQSDPALVMAHANVRRILAGT